MSINTYVLMLARMIHITCITQASLKTINNALLVHDLWLFLFYFWRLLRVLVSYSSMNKIVDGEISQTLLVFKSWENFL